MQSKIITLTINPALDANTTTSEVVAERKIRCTTPRFDAGGGGVNVSRAIKHLGGESVAFFPIGGATGRAFKSLLNEEGIDHYTCSIEGWTRENLSIFEETSGEQYRFVMPGPTLSETEWRGCLNALASLASSADYVVASGSLPPGIPVDFYAQVAQMVSRADSRFIVDTSGEALRAAMEAGAYLIKPNRREVELLVGRSLKEMAQLVDGVQELIRTTSTEIIVVSLGSEGALLATGERVDLLSAPSVPVASKVGAGDSMVAGIVLGLSRGCPLLDAVRTGVAAGTAAVITSNTELCRQEDAERLYQQVVCSQLQ